MSGGSITLAEFSRDVVGPMILRGIERGDYDNVLGEMLTECADIFDDETLRAMLARAYIVCTSPAPFENWLTAPADSKMKVGAQLRIKLPGDYGDPGVFDGVMPWNR